MALQPEDIRKIAHLARLQVNDNDIPQYVDDLSNILTLIEQMNSTNTDDIEPMAHPLHASQRLRPDAVTTDNVREVMQAIAPQTADGLYLVPTVIEQED